MRVCVCVYRCVCEREREKECERVHMGVIKYMNLYVGVCEGRGLVGGVYMRFRERACVYYVHNYMYMSMSMCVCEPAPPSTLPLLFTSK